MKQVLDDAIALHVAWTQMFTDELASGNISERTRVAGYDDLCTAGKWLYGLDDSVKLQPAYRKVKDLHYQFHTVAGEVVELILNRAFDRARRLLESDYTFTSRQLVVALREWQSHNEEQTMKSFHAPE